MVVRSGHEDLAKSSYFEDRKEYRMLRVDDRAIALVAEVDNADLDSIVHDSCQLELAGVADVEDGNRWTTS